MSQESQSQKPSIKQSIESVRQIFAQSNNINKNVYDLTEVVTISNNGKYQHVKHTICNNKQNNDDASRHRYDTVSDVENMLSNNVHTVISSDKLNHLVANVLQQCLNEHDHKYMANIGKLIAQLVDNVLIGELRRWLDTHLPEMVNRIVTEEIRRIVDGK